MAGASDEARPCFISCTQARSSASRQVSLAASKARGFSAEVAAFEAAPQLYMQRKALETFAGLDAVRKYLIVGDPSNVMIEYESDVEGGLDQVLTKGLESDGQ